MSSTAEEEIALLERVLLCYGNANTDEQLESTVGKFLAPVILKITSPHEDVRNKVIEVLTHINKRLKSRSSVQLPMEALITQYCSSNSAFLENFSIIYIAMGFPRMTVDKQTEFAPKILASSQGKPEAHKDKLLKLLLPLLNKIKIPDDPELRKNMLGLNQNPAIKKEFLSVLQDVLLLPYGVTQDAGLPPGLSPYSFKRVLTTNWKAEELEECKKGIVRFICGGALSDLENFILLVLASSDTRFSVATPAIAELSKVCTTLDFTNPVVTAPLYGLFSGNMTKNSERKTSPCNARVRQKLLQYLIRCRGSGIHTAKGIQVIFEGLFGEHTNQKCKVLSLQFCENLIKDGPPDILSKVAKVIQSGISKLIVRDTTEPIEVQNAAYSAMAQLARTCPFVVNKDLKIVVTYFNHLANAPADLHTSIREALVSIAPAFAWNRDSMETDDVSEFVLSSQQNLLLAMLSDNAESKLNIVQNVTSVFLTTCFPEHFAPARFLLLLIAGERTSLRETVTSYLYGVSKKDQINYNMISSIDFPDTSVDDFNRLSSEQRRVILPSFKDMINHVIAVAYRRAMNPAQQVVVGNFKLPFTFNVYEEILDYLRLCLWYSAGVKGAPGDEQNIPVFKRYINENFMHIENNDLNKYIKFVQICVEAKRFEFNLVCLHDLLNVAPAKLTMSKMHLLEPLSNSLREITETTRTHAAKIYGILLAYGLSDQQFDLKMRLITETLPQQTVEAKHGWILALGHAFCNKILAYKEQKIEKNFVRWIVYIDSVHDLVQLLFESQPLIVLAALQSLSMIAKVAKMPHFDVKITFNDDEGQFAEDATAPTKHLIFNVIFNLVRTASARPRCREEAARCIGSLAIGDGEYYTRKCLDKIFALVKLSKDVSLNIAIAQSIVCIINGYDVNIGPPTEGFQNQYCTDTVFDTFFNRLIRQISNPNPQSRQACAVWLLAVVKHCSHRPGLLAKRQILQLAFTELLSDESEFIQDVASRGLGLVFALSDSTSQNDLANSLLDHLIGGKRNVNQVEDDTELFAEGVLGKTPTGGNITTYKELCGLASDLNQPDMIYQFMQLANHNAAWTSKLGAAFGLKAISKDAKSKMTPYLAKIIPRLYRYKYDPTPKIQNSMISIWDSIVTDSKDVIELYYWDILREILDNLTFNEWRVRIACCLAVRDLLKRPTGLKLRIDKTVSNPKSEPDKMEVDDEVPEPELRELWAQLFRVMDDYHEGTRLAATGTANVLSKICVTAASSEHGKSGVAVASSILPFLLETGVTNTVLEIRKISIQTISELIESSGALITPHLPSLIPCLLKATGELETPKLSYLSTRLGAQSDAQEAVDSLRAEAAKSHHTMETTAKCVRYIDYEALEKMTPAILDLIKSTVNLGTKVACAHFVCLISIRLGKEMTPLAGKYLGACFTGLKDRNSIVRKYNASAIGHLLGVAKEQSIKNLLAKLEEFYMENTSNKGVPLTIQSINKRHHELLRDYMENVLPLIFFAMHEEANDENKANLELWKELWIDISPGDAGIRMNLAAIIPRLEKTLEDASWSRKTQSANAINTIATRLGADLEAPHRLRLINLLLVALQGRTFQGKERLLQSLASLCKGLDKNHEICTEIIDAVMKECRKEEPQYRIHALKSIGDILQELEADRFEEIYNMIGHLLEKTDLNSMVAKDDGDEEMVKDMTPDERSKQAGILNSMKESIAETLGNAWPKNSIETQNKYELLFIEHCSNCLRNSTRPVQLSLLTAMGRYLEKLLIFKKEEFEESDCKKPKIDREITKEKICNNVISSVSFAANLPHMGVKKEALNIVLILIKRMTGADYPAFTAQIKSSVEGLMQLYQNESSPEIRCRIKDIEEKLKNI